MDKFEVSAFWSKVKIGLKRDCWMWTGASNGRYGVFRGVRAHRYSWEFFNEKKIGELHVCHACDTPLCVNPLHLFLGTHEENMADMKRKGRGRKPATPTEPEQFEP